MGEPAVVSEALTQCSFGLTPAPLNVIPTTVMIEGRPAAVITNSEIVNIATFGMCTSLANPEVASATAAALGVLTPMACVPVLVPWIPGAPTTLIEDQPALTSSCTTICAWGGEIEITFPGTVQTTV